jgi:hypothetical protein
MLGQYQLALANAGTISPPIGQCWNNLTSYLTEIPPSRGVYVNATTNLVYCEAEVWGVDVQTVRQEAVGAPI